MRGRSGDPFQPKLTEFISFQSPPTEESHNASDYQTTNNMIGRNEMRKMAHERASSETPINVQENTEAINMDTEAIENQEYDLDLSKFTSRQVETYRINHDADSKIDEAYCSA